MLETHGLNYGNRPKGLLPFHINDDQNVITAFEEHLLESANYASSNKPVNIHFTVSEVHRKKFTDELETIKNRVEQATGKTFNISFSFQKSSTDTLAVCMSDKPFRNDDGTLLFRPSGHGALLENLNELEADIAFVKNIDNVVVSKYRDEVANQKKVLAGVLIELQNITFNYLHKIDNETLSHDDIVEIAEFLSNKLNVVISHEFEKYAEKYQIAYLRDKLNRPIRVCGMVKNEGEPGGGPFWVKDESANISLQIVESAQIDKSNTQQKDILLSATHFNPVELVCGLKYYKGNKLDFLKYVDNKSAFI